MIRLDNSLITREIDGETVELRMYGDPNPDGYVLSAGTFYIKKADLIALVKEQEKKGKPPGIKIVDADYAHVPWDWQAEEAALKK